MKDAKSIELPLVGHVRLSKTMSPQTEMEVQEMKMIPYVSCVESIMYSIVCCRPDLAHAMSQVSGFMAQFGKKH